MFVSELTTTEEERKHGSHHLSLKSIILGLLFVLNAISSAKAASVILFTGKAILFTIMAKFLLTIIVIKNLSSSKSSKEGHHRGLPSQLSGSEFLFKMPEEFSALSRWYLKKKRHLKYFINQFWISIFYINDCFLASPQRFINSAQNSSALL